ncbi:MAG: TetR/AcrR family transcriptional regulator, partial [Chloroflexota bacterium]
MVDRQVCMLYCLGMQIKHSTNAGPRERILARAVELFFKQGYHGTGINQIIKEAKVAKASFYDHFGSKENLAVAYLELLSDRRIDLLDRVASDYDDPFEKVMSIFEYLKEWAEDKHHIGCPFLNIASEFPLEDNRIRETVRTHNDLPNKVTLTFFVG